MILEVYIPDEYIENYQFTKFQNAFDNAIEDIEEKKYAGKETQSGQNTVSVLRMLKCAFKTSKYVVK